jgi:hypothetical protein
VEGSPHLTRDALVRVRVTRDALVRVRAGRAVRGREWCSGVCVEQPANHSLVLRLVLARLVLEELDAPFAQIG